MADKPNKVPRWRDRAVELREKGLSRAAISRIIKVPEETVRYWIMSEQERDQKREVMREKASARNAMRYAHA